MEVSDSSDIFSGVFNALNSARLSTEVETFIVISALSFIPFFLIAATTFTRNIVVLAFLRHALGLQQSPPNIVLVSLALFLTLFTMEPVFEQSYNLGLKPYIDEEISAESAVDQAIKPFRSFMINQTNESDIKLVYELSNEQLPELTKDIKLTHIVPAFLLSELKTAFKIGFIIFLPFLLIDIVMAAILMSLGMIMVPPITISLPLKIMLFVVVDGWGLIAKTLIQSVSG